MNDQLAKVRSSTEAVEVFRNQLALMSLARRFTRERHMRKAFACAAWFDANRAHVWTSLTPKDRALYWYERALLSQVRLDPDTDAATDMLRLSCQEVESAPDQPLTGCEMSWAVSQTELVNSLLIGSHDLHASGYSLLLGKLRTGREYFAQAKTVLATRWHIISWLHEAALHYRCRAFDDFRSALHHATTLRNKSTILTGWRPFQRRDITILRAADALLRNDRYRARCIIARIASMKDGRGRRPDRVLDVLRLALAASEDSSEQMALTQAIDGLSEGRSSLGKRMHIAVK